jgi:uncharacterized protein YjbI with pentapeptide repeats
LEKASRKEANLEGANWRDAKNLTQEQLRSAESLQDAILPPEFAHLQNPQPD